MAVYFSPEGLEYNPYSVDELLKPLDKYQEAYNAIDKKYQELMLDPKTFKSLLDPSVDRKSYEAFENYNKNLTAAYDNFANNGIKGAMNQLSSLRQQYAALAPIESAYTARAKDIERMQRIQSKGNLVDVDPSSLSVDDYVSGNYSRMNELNISQIKSEAAQEAALLFNQYRQENAYKQRYAGLSVEDLSNALDGDDDPKSIAIRGAIDAIKEKYSAYTGLNSYQSDLIDNAIYNEFIKQFSKYKDPPKPTKTEVAISSNTSQDNPGDDV